MATEKKNVVVIGLGLGGSAVAQALAKVLPPTHRVVAISEKPFGFFPIAALRASVVPGWEDKTTLTNAGIFAKGSRHVLLAGTKVVSIGKDLHTLHIDTAHPSLGFDFEVPFEYAIVATGSTYAFPARPTIESRAIADVVATHRSAQKDLEASSSILVVGAGATGIEYAGEVKSQYPKKKVTLVCSTSSLFSDPSYNKKLGATLTKQLTALGVKIEFNTRLDTTGVATGRVAKKFTFASGNSVDVDYVMLATGNKVNSELVSDLDASAVNDAGYIKVRDTLQLVKPAYSHIFAIGDCTDRPENKQAVTAGNHVPIAAANVVALIKGSTALKSHKVGGPMLLVTCGPGGGAAQLFGFVFGGFLAKNMKSKSLLLSIFQGAYPAPK